MRLCKTVMAGLAGMMATASVGRATEAYPTFHDLVTVVDQAPHLWNVTPGQPVAVRFKAGELRVVASDAGELATELTVTCPDLPAERCEKYRRKARLEVRSEGDGVRVGLTGVPIWRLRRLQLEGEIRYPTTSPLDLRVGAGDIDVTTGEADVAVRMRVGDLSLQGQRRYVESVTLRTTIGDVSLRTAGAVLEGRRKKLLGSSLAWSEGVGSAHLEAEVSIGVAAVTLDDGGRVAD